MLIRTYMSLRVVCSDYGPPAIQKEVQVGNAQEKAQSEKDSHSKNRGGKKQTNNKVLIPCKHFVRRMSSYFSQWVTTQLP